MFWLKDGDRNSKFFYSSVKARKKINSISSLMNDDGNISYMHQYLFCVAKNYFDGLFKGGPNDVAGNLDYIRHTIFEDTNIMLVPFSMKRI